MPDQEITRKVTWGDKYKHYLTTNIIGCQVLTQPRPDLPGKAYIRFSTQLNITQDREGLPAEHPLKRITPEAYKRIAKGCPTSSSKKLKHKLVGQSRYNFILVAEKMKNEEGKEEEVICNVHSYPNSTTRDSNYNETDRRFPLDEDSALVQFYEDGNIDICAYPNQFSFSLQAFINELEKLEKVGSKTTFTIPGPDSTVRVSVTSIYGDTFIMSLTQE